MVKITVVAVREVDLRVLLVHVAVEVGLISQTFHSSEQRQGFNRVLSNEVEDAEGLDREQVGEDVIEGKRPRRPSYKDIQHRDRNGCRKCATQIPFTLNAVCPHWKSADQCTTCAL